MRLDEELNKRKEKFIEHCAIHGNATRAIVEAGYEGDCATQVAYREMRKEGVREAIKERQQELIEKIKLDKEYILERMIEIANLYKEDPQHAAQSLKSLEKLGQIMGLWDSGMKTVNERSHEEWLKLLR